MMPRIRRFVMPHIASRIPLPPIIVLAVCCVALACQPGVEEVELPPEMIGRWVTRTPSHAKTYFELAPDRLTFGTLEGPEEYTIYRVTIDREPHVPKYTIEYHTVDGVTPFTFWYQARHKVIRWDHRWNMIWQREGDKPLVREQNARLGGQASSPLEPLPPQGPRRGDASTERLRS